MGILGDVVVDRYRILGDVVVDRYRLYIDDCGVSTVCGEWLWSGRQLTGG